MAESERTPSALCVPNYVAPEDTKTWVARGMRATVDELCLAEVPPTSTTGRWICVLPKNHEEPHE